MDFQLSRPALQFRSVLDAAFLGVGLGILELGFLELGFLELGFLELGFFWSENLTFCGLGFRLL